MPDVRSVTAGFWVGTGSRDEEGPDSGCSHFLEHLLFKGTPTRSAREIAELIDAVGGDMNAYTTKEYTAFYVRVLDESAEMGLDVLCDLMYAPAFRPDEVEAERQVILEEILMHGDEPADLVHEVFAEAMYPDHALGREVLGTEETIEAMTVDRIAGFYEHHYRPGNMVIGAAGKLDHDAFVAGLEARFAGRSGGSTPVRVAPTAAVEPLRVVTRDTEQAHLVLGVPGLDRQHPDRYALSVLNHALGGGLSSRLFQEIREKRGLAYSVYSYRSAFADTGSLCIYAGTNPERVAEVLDLMVTEVDRVASDGLTDRELAVAVGHLKGEMALALEDSAARMSRIGRSLLVHGAIPSQDDVVAHIESVTLDGVNRLAGSLLGGQRVLAVVGPFETSDFKSFA